MLIELARRAVLLLRSGEGDAGGMNRLWEHRRKGLHAAGFLRGRMQVDQLRLRSALRDRFAPDLLDELRCGPGQASSDDCIARMARPPRRSAHPVYHLLFAVLLGQDVLGASDGNHGRERAVSPPAECMPAVSNARTGKGVRDRDISDAIARRLDAEPSAIAGDLGIDVMTVKRAAWRLGLWGSHWTFSERVAPATRGRDGQASRLEAAKRKWCEIREALPSLGRKGLRSAEPGIHALLYRRDPAWLEANSPPATLSGGMGRRVDWAGRDRDVSCAIAAAASNLDRLRRVRAVRPATLAREAGVLSVVAQHRDRPSDTDRVIARGIEHAPAEARFSSEIPGGWQTAEDAWPELQERLIDSMVKLEKTMKPELARLP